MHVYGGTRYTCLQCLGKSVACLPSVGRDLITFTAASNLSFIGRALPGVAILKYHVLDWQIKYWGRVHAANFTTHFPLTFHCMAACDMHESAFVEWIYNKTSQWLQVTS